ncbi:MAG: hypothetical protein AABO58_15745 [Acidobacteriota bacterium]
MKTAALFVLALTLASGCATSDDPPADSRPARMPRNVETPSGFDVPPPNWWRDPQVSVNVKLSDAQFASLDAIDREHAAEVARLRMDVAAAERDVRLLLAAEKPTADDIVAAGQRVRTLRDQILDHELRMLAEERALLTREQWTALQDALRDERLDAGGRRGGFGGGRGGGRRGGGRRPF